MVRQFWRASSLALIMAVLMMATALAYANSVTYRGQGLTADGFGGYDLNSELCGLENGADADGPYLLWVLTATGANNADITFHGGSAVAMTRVGNGTFKYISGWIDPDALLLHPPVATYDGRARNAQLVVSHGCRPYETEGIWCAPAFWNKAPSNGAWALTGYDKTALFNATVYDEWYGASFVADPTLGTVLSDGVTYGGLPVAGTKGYALNAQQATAAFLTDNIPGYHFDWDAMIANNSDSCPIDSMGNPKPPPTPK